MYCMYYVDVNTWTHWLDMDGAYRCLLRCPLLSCEAILRAIGGGGRPAAAGPDSGAATYVLLFDAECRLEWILYISSLVTSFGCGIRGRNSLPMFFQLSSPGTFHANEVAGNILALHTKLKVLIL